MILSILYHDTQPDTGDQCSQRVAATLVPNTPIGYFFNITKLQCKQTVVTHFCIWINFVNKISTVKIKRNMDCKKKKKKSDVRSRLMTFCPFSSISAWSKKASEFCGHACRLGLRLGWGYMSLSLVFLSNVVCVKTRQKHCNIKHFDKSKQ